MKANDNPQKIYDFLKKHPNTYYCDDCLEKQTGVNRHQVNTIAATLGLFPKEFTRTESVCSQCRTDRDKMVTRSN